jgi:O-antigen/teichoic acid export membrane protein
VTTPENLSPATRWSSIVVIWVVALLASVAIGIFSRPSGYADWLALTLAACTFLSMCVQLATQEKHGFVNRLAASVIGALGVLALATAVLSLLSIGR